MCIPLSSSIQVDLIALGTPPMWVELLSRFNGAEQGRIAKVGLQILGCFLAFIHLVKCFAQHPVKETLVSSMGTNPLRMTTRPIRLCTSFILLSGAISNKALILSGFTNFHLSLVDYEAREIFR